MSNFFAILPRGNASGAALALFRQGLSAARLLKSQVPSGTQENEWAYAAAFSRISGGGAPVVVDPATGSWMIASGSWFHRDGYACGDEGRLLSRYLEVGPRAVGRELEGFFCLVVGDARSSEVIVITDIVGSCHGFVRQMEEGLALSGSSMLLAALRVTALDTTGCQEFLHTGVIYEDRTLYQDVRKLEPATVFRFARGALQSQERYWEIMELGEYSLDGREATEALWAATVAAAKRIGRRFPRVVCDLTGGYDSRALVAAFLSSGVPFATTVSGPPDSADVVISQRVAHAFGLPHLISADAPLNLELVQSALAYTDGECDLVDYARILHIHRDLMTRFDISLNGSFGEVARGYWWELLFPHAGASRSLDARKLARRRFAAEVIDSSLFPKENRLEPAAHFTQVIERINAGMHRLPNTVQMDHIYLTMRMHRWQGRLASSTDQLWPCLSPFLFRSVLEAMLRTAPRLRRRGLLVRQMLAQHQPRLAEFPLEHGYPAVPFSIRTAWRFTPIAGYYAAKIRDRAVRHLGLSRMLTSTASGSRQASLMQQDAVRDLFDPSTMQLGALLDEGKLTTYVEALRRDLTAPGWTRMLSLELLLRSLGQAGVRPKL